MGRPLPVLTIFILASFTGSGKVQGTKSFGVCEAIARATDMNGKEISIHGNFEKDLEHTDLTSPQCRKGIAVLPTKAAGQDPAFKAILAVYYCPPFQSKGKRISGEFIGRFEWNSHRAPEWVLHVYRVTRLHLEVEACGTP